MSIFKTSPSSKNSRKPAAKGHSARKAAQNRSATSFWDNLSPERRLDLVGVLLGIAGILILLMLVATSRSALTGGFIHLLGDLIGWGIYVLPLALVVFGLWLILRK